MKVCSHKGLLIAVLTRNEHCPPHVHVGSANWDARFLFSFWHSRRGGQPPRLGALSIQSAHFDAQAYKTVLRLAGQSSPLEIAL